MQDEKTLFAEMERELGGTICHDDPKGKALHHYTDAAGFEGIVSSKTLRGTHFRHLNDKGELSAGECLINEEVKKLAPHLGTANQKWFVETFEPIHRQMSLSTLGDIFVASLSEHDDHLSQWRGYGDHAAGYSLGFAKFRLPAPEANPPNATQALHLAKCGYDEDNYRARVRHVLTDSAKGFERFVASHAKTYEQADAIARQATALALRRVAMLVLGYKVAAFREEAEWRLIAIPHKGAERQISFRPARGVLVPYVPIDLCEEGELIALSSVVLGPTVEPERGEHGARMLLSRYGYDPQIVRRSTIPFRG